jgi:hypothetical protein
MNAYPTVFAQIMAFRCTSFGNASGVAPEPSGEAVFFGFHVKMAFGLKKGSNSRERQAFDPPSGSPSTVQRIGRGATLR